MKDRSDELHDGKISALYQETRQPESPDWLDRRILTVARAAAEPPPAFPKRSAVRWAAPLALAATVVLTVGVVRMAREAGELGAPLRSEPAKPGVKSVMKADATSGRGAGASSAGVSLPQATPSVIAPPAASAESSMGPPAGSSVSPPSVASPATADRAMPSSALPSPARVADDQPLDGNAMPSRELTLSPDSAAAPATASEPAASRRAMPVEERKESETHETTPTPKKNEASPSDAGRLSHHAPEEWLKEIAELRRQGRTAEAEAQALKFSQTYPHYRLEVESPPR